METFELRYFLAAAEFENINKAAVRLAVSAPAVSRAIARLEDELGVLLFERVGRNVVLSTQGKQLQREVSRIIGDLDDVKSKFKPVNYNHSIVISGTEFGLSAYLSSILKKLNQAKVAFISEAKLGESSQDVERKVLDGEAHLGILARRPSAQFRSIKLGVLKSKVYVGEDHPLYAIAKSAKSIPVEKVLQYEFAGFLEPLTFELNPSDISADGWRDDKFPRRIALKAESIESALRAVEAGIYLSYLPEAIAKNRKLLPLKIEGCPYTCETEIFLLCKKEMQFSWMKNLF